MWTALIGLAASVLPAILRLFGGGDKTADQARELGRAEQQNADMKGDMATVRAANDAAKKAEASNAPDPNDLDARG